MLRFWGKTPVNSSESAVDDVLSRGVAEAIVKEDLRRALLSGRRLRVKLGIDPTSPHIHLGRAVALLKLRDFQKLGHTPVFIVGDFTGIIGDTSDKDAERPMLSRQIIEENKKTYLAQAGKLIDLSRVEHRYNSEWLAPLSYKDVGAHADLFSVADFIARENVSVRLREGRRVSLREVLYPLMQGFDSVAVAADVELGGTDQKFNLLAGRVLQEAHGQRPQNILMNPLIRGLDGRKMSSSWGNTVNLTDNAKDMYGKIMSLADTELVDYFTLCTRVPMAEVEELTRGFAQGSGRPKEAKMRLAREIVALYHGPAAAQAAQEAFTAVFGEKKFPADARRVHARNLLEAVAAAGHSKGEARRLIAARAVTSLKEGREFPHDDPYENITEELLLRVGKKTFIRALPKK